MEILACPAAGSIRIEAVRPFERDDLPAAAGLFQQVFRRGGNAMPAPESLRRYMEELYFEHPWQDSRCRSLVHQHDSGKIDGFIGARPLRMQIKGRPILAAVAGGFMVDARLAGPLAGAQLLRALIHGGQDLTISDGANEVSRKMWEAAGGATCFAQGLNWIRPLRPAGLAIGELLRRRMVPQLVGAALKYPLAGADRLAAALVRPLTPKPPQGVIDTSLTREELLAAKRQIESRYALRPDYDAASLAWVLDQARRKDQYGALCERGVRDAAGRLVGWFMYYSRRGETARVLQMDAMPHAMEATADALLHHAWTHGAAAVAARISPRWIAPLYPRGGVLVQRRPYVVVHTDQPDVMSALDRGDAFFSRLEGEWWTKLTSDQFV